MKAIVYT